MLGVDGGMVAWATVALTGLSDRATRLSAVEAALKGKPATPDSMRAAAKQASVGGTVYQKNLACVYTERALLRARARANGGK